MYVCDVGDLVYVCGCSYLEQEQHMFLAAHCLNVTFAGTQNHMQIDLASVEALELVKPLAVGTASKKGNSLYRCGLSLCMRHPWLWVMVWLFVIWL